MRSIRRGVSKAKSRESTQMLARLGDDCLLEANVEDAFAVTLHLNQRRESGGELACVARIGGGDDQVSLRKRGFT